MFMQRTERADKLLNRRNRKFETVNESQTCARVKNKRERERKKIVKGVAHASSDLDLTLKHAGRSEEKKPLTLSFLSDLKQPITYAIHPDNGKEFHALVFSHGIGSPAAHSHNVVEQAPVHCINLATIFVFCNQSVPID